MSDEWKKIPGESLQTLNSYVSEYYLLNAYPATSTTIAIAKNNTYTYTPVSNFGLLLVVNQQSVNYSGIVHYNTSVCSSLVCGNNLYVVSTIPNSSETKGIYIAKNSNAIKIWNNTDSSQTFVVNGTVVKLD